MTNTAVNFSLCTAADSAEMSRLFGDVFAKWDPPAVAVGLTAAEFEAFVRRYSPKAPAEELRVVARSAATGELVGALLAEDSGDAVRQVAADRPITIRDLLTHTPAVRSSEPLPPGV